MFIWIREHKSTESHSRDERSNYVLQHPFLWGFDDTIKKNIYIYLSTQLTGVTLFIDCAPENRREKSKQRNRHTKQSAFTLQMRAIHNVWRETLWNSYK